MHGLIDLCRLYKWLLSLAVPDGEGDGLLVVLTIALVLVIILALVLHALLTVLLVILSGKPSPTLGLAERRVEHLRRVLLSASAAFGTTHHRIAPLPEHDAVDADLPRLGHTLSEHVRLHVPETSASAVHA